MGMQLNFIGHVGVLYLPLSTFFFFSFIHIFINNRKKNIKIAQHNHRTVCITFTNVYCVLTMISIWLDSFCHCHKITERRNKTVCREYCFVNAILSFHQTFLLFTLYYFKWTRNKSFLSLKWFWNTICLIFFSFVLIVKGLWTIRIGRFWLWNVLCQWIFSFIFVDV